MKTPGSSITGFGVNDHFCAGGRERTLIEIVGTKEEGVGGKFWIEAGVAEQIQSDDCLGDQPIPFT